MKIDEDKVLDLMRNEHNVNIPGCVLLFLADALRDRQVSLYRAKIAADLIGSKDKADELEMSAEANETVGGLMLSMISDVFGREFMEAYISGKIELPDDPLGRSRMN